MLPRGQMLAKLGRQLYNNSIRPPKKQSADDEVITSNHATLSCMWSVVEVDHQTPITEGPTVPATSIGKKRSENNYIITCWLACSVNTKAVEKSRIRISVGAVEVHHPRLLWCLTPILTYPNANPNPNPNPNPVAYLEDAWRGLNHNGPLIIRHLFRSSQLNTLMNCLGHAEWVSEQFLNGTWAHNRLFSAMKLL